MKVFDSHHHSAAALIDAVVHGFYQGVHDALRDIYVPIIRNKSSKQEALDIVHPLINEMAEVWFSQLVGWDRQCTVVELTDGADGSKKTIDFAFTLPDGRRVLLEIQLGNGGRVQADFAKFRTVYERGLLALGIIVYLTRDTAVRADSGLANYESAVEEAAKLPDMPLVLMGISAEETPEVDLCEAPWYVYPSLFGGSGPKDVQRATAETILDRKPLSTFELEPALYEAVCMHHREHLEKELASVSALIKQTLECRDPRQQPGLLALLLEFSRSTYLPADERARVIKAGAEQLTLNGEIGKAHKRDLSKVERKNERLETSLRAARAELVKLKRQLARLTSAPTASDAPDAADNAHVQAGLTSAYPLRRGRNAQRARASALAKSLTQGETHSFPSGGDEQASTGQAAGPAQDAPAARPPLPASSSPAVASASQASTAAPCGEMASPVPVAAQKVIRVSRADEARRLAAAEQARAPKPLSSPSSYRAPTWNAMGQAWSDAMARAGHR